jgi:2-oxoglutarate ferredoxin oxidoreductase subunit beta
MSRHVYRRPESLRDVPTITARLHGIAHRLVAEVLDELGIRERTILVAPVGCSVLAYQYFNTDGAEAAHGRAPAMATGIKRVQPDRVVFTYQGDGDLAAIGTGEIIHTATRGENITTIFINNAIYGMTGGQMAPTTLPGQTTKSSPTGRDVELMGFPMKMAELLSNMDGSAYIVRRSLHNVKEINKAKKAIRTAFKVQLAGLGFSMVELLSSCPTNEVDSVKRWRVENTRSYYLATKVSEAVQALAKGGRPCERILSPDWRAGRLVRRAAAAYTALAENKPVTGSVLGGDARQHGELPSSSATRSDRLAGLCIRISPWCFNPRWKSARTVKPAVCWSSTSRWSCARPSAPIWTSWCCPPPPSPPNWDR